MVDETGWGTAVDLLVTNVPVGRETFLANLIAGGWEMYIGLRDVEFRI